MKNRIFVRTQLILPLLLILVCHTGNANGQPSVSDTAGVSFGLFENEAPLEVTLKFDITTYLRKKPKDEYMKGKITFHPGSPDSLTREIRIRTRGVFRHTECYYAPLELNFRNAHFGYSDLDSIRRIKMVPQCNSGRESEKYVLTEYLIYKMFSTLTDTSFKVRLLTVNYVDSENKQKPFTQYAFLIEPVQVLAARTNSIEVESRALNQKSVYPAMIDRIAIFNYMIGNFDWAVPNQHNIKTFKPRVFDSDYLVTAVPYDFDFTGLVDASYAVPDDKITGTTSIRERIFLGVCRSREVYQQALVEFLEKKEEIYGLINEFPYLDAKQKKKMISYLETFYEQCTGKQKIVNVFLNSCKDF
ncbi:hypothetical protein EG832_08430 [bacterium]|nr:hypothetical protein [bacterium]